MVKLKIDFEELETEYASMEDRTTMLAQIMKNKLVNMKEKLNKW